MRPKNTFQSEKLLGSIATCAVFLLPLPGQATTTTASISMNTLHLSSPEMKWEAGTYLARDLVETLNSSGARGMLALDDAWEMDQRSPLMRGLFLFTAGQAQARFTWANSVLAHEYAHFQHAHGFGMTEHYFRDEASGDKFDAYEAWINTFLKGDPGGPATSRDGPDGRDTERDAKEGIKRAAAGLNWQMGYSEGRLRSWLTGQNRTVFDAADFILNRGYTLGYSLGSKLKDGDGDEVHGDPVKFAAHLKDVAGEKNALEQMIGFSLLANILSPNLHAMFGSIEHYVADGSTEVTPFRHKTPTSGYVTWDIPQYLNVGNMSLAPTLYWIPEAENTRHLGAEYLVLGVAAEIAVVGMPSQETRLTVDGKWGKVSVSGGMTFATEGKFSELSLGYDIAKGLALTAGGVFKSGDTMRGDRDLPDADGIAWAGLNYRF